MKPARLIASDHPQQTAISSDESHLLVVASPGSGKTYCLAERIKRLVDDQVPYTVPAAAMVAISFTNAAGDELRDRLGFEIGFTGTLHAFALQLLQRWGYHIGLPRTLAVIDDEQAGLLLAEEMKSHGCKTSKKEMDKLLEAGPAAFLSGPNRRLEEVVAFNYFKTLQKSGLLHFDTILQYAVMLIQALKCRPEDWPWTHLFVDEVQDSSNIDCEIYQQAFFLSRFYVGDPDQSIYAFRGANVGNVMRTAGNDQFGTIYMEANRRCDREICEAAEKLIGHNTKRLPKRTISATGNEGTIELWKDLNGEMTEAMAIIKDISARPFPDQSAVLVRTNPLAKKYATMLREAGVPVKTRQSAPRPEDWYECRRFVNLAANPTNDHLAYLCAKWKYGGAREANRLKLEAMKAGISLAVYSRVIDKTFDIAGIPNWLVENHFSSQSIALVNSALSELPAFSGRDQLSLALANQELLAQDEGFGVTVCTIHRAKGREWDTVYLPALEDGILPILREDTDIDEERRLLFVGLTRARRRVVLSYCRARTPAWGSKRPEPAVPSRFLGEML